MKNKEEEKEIEKSPVHHRYHRRLRNMYQVHRTSKIMAVSTKTTCHTIQPSI